LEQEIVITEKLDGENTCIKSNGVYARSHLSPTRNPWAGNMWQIWENIGHELGDLEVFGENLYGVHSIEYPKLSYHFFVFAIRDGDTWYAWDDVVFFAELMDLPTVPVIERGHFSPTEIETIIAHHITYGSAFGATTEGVVLRNAMSFDSNHFKFNVLKYVRANHVKTDQHWTRNWRRAQLWYE